MATAASSALNQQPFEQEQTVPQGIDQTAQSIADILGLDITTATDSLAATNIVVDGVLRFIELYQECQQELTEAQQQLQESQQPEVDENGNPVGEVDENGNPVDPNTPPVDPNAAPPVNPNAPPPAQKQLPVSGKPKVAPPAAKPNPFAKKKPPIQASFSPQVMKLALGSRQRQLLQLAEEGYITPDVLKIWTNKYCSNDALALSLSDENADDFDFQVETTIRNGRVIDYGEKTPDQSAMRELVMAHGAGPHIEYTSPLIADAKSRNK